MSKVSAFGSNGAGNPAASSSRVARVSIGILSVLILVLCAAAVVQMEELKDLRDAESQRTAVTRAASRQVVLLTTVDSETSAADIDRLLRGGTKSFRAQFEQDSAAFFAALKDAKVVSKGSVDAVGITRISDASAEVIVAATAMVSNQTTEAPENRLYRLQVKVERESGTWLVDAIRFVV